MSSKLNLIVFLIIISLTFIGNKLFVKDKINIKVQSYFVEKQDELDIF